MASTKSALETTELLEMILLQLPIRSVLRFHRVSHLWRATIKTSIKIQQALFNRPIPAPTTTTKRTMHDTTLTTTCAQILSSPARSTIINDILCIAGSAAKISHPPHRIVASKTFWRSMQLTQPPTTCDFLVGNFIALAASEALGVPKDQFIPSDPSRALESKHSMAQGSFSRLGALHLHSTSGLTLGMVAEGVARLRERFEGAEHKGRELRFFWGSQVRAEVMVDLLEEIQGVVEGEVARMRREVRR